MNVSPKQRFLSEEKLARQFLDMVDSEAFARASELSMIAFMEDAKSLEEIKGAQRFLTILKTLPEQAKLLSPRQSYNLDHTLK